MNRDFPETLINFLLRSSDSFFDKSKEAIPIASFSLVITKEIKHEADVFLRSLRTYHDEPVYILCDDESKRLLSKKYKNLFFKTSANQEDLLKINKQKLSKIKDIDRFHRKDCIYKKMECLEYALSEAPNTFFMDADIIVLDNLQEHFTRPVALSPHYHHKEKSSISKFCGIFNAGYVFCATKRLPGLWKSLYLHKSDFYEQRGMNYFCEFFDIDIIPPTHNVGFWRNTEDEYLNAKKICIDLELEMKPKSFHVHILEEIDFKGHTVVEDKNRAMKNIVLKYLKENNYKDIYNYIINYKM
tara:strand:- start:1842 stop:2741 length:900 start_codon:yes stop_codon:yes gene_type:complete